MLQDCLSLRNSMNLDVAKLIIMPAMLPAAMPIIGLSRTNVYDVISQL
ncbi:hypothetical protein yinte0001_18970 [Yersinia intermedia ATCC 29909]|nr:hypothetical protein yinte0001_18970 [Yersinia intermedia ATCC 29909]